MDYLLFFLIVPLSIYFIFLLICISGLSAVKINTDKTIYTFSPNTSVIVCVRNGEKSLPYIFSNIKTLEILMFLIKVRSDCLENECLKEIYIYINK